MSINDRCNLVLNQSSVVALKVSTRCNHTMAIKCNIICVLVIVMWTGHGMCAVLSTDRDVSEQTILELADKSNKTFLKLIGLAIQNLRCDFDNCNNWSEWTSDILYKGQFGVKTRSRDCWYNSCDKTGEKVVENDSEIFEGRCPTSYNITDGKFCLAYHPTKMNHSAAHQLCAKDGGHIINVDTKERYDLAQKYAPGANIHIQGERRVAGGPFFDDAGNHPEERSFFKWGANEPSNNTNELYLMLSSSGLCDIYGNNVYYVLCEK